MSHQGPTPHCQKVFSGALQLNGQNSKTLVEEKREEEEMDFEMSPEEVVVKTDVSNLLVRGKVKRELDMIDGLQSTAEVIDKILMIMGELMDKVVALEENDIGRRALKDLLERMRALEDRSQSPTPAKTGCSWYCNKNSFSI